MTPEDRFEGRKQPNYVRLEDCFDSRIENNTRLTAVETKLDAVIIDTKEIKEDVKEIRDVLLDAQVKKRILDNIFYIWRDIPKTVKGIFWILVAILSLVAGGLTVSAVG